MLLKVEDQDILQREIERVEVKDVLQREAEKETPEDLKQAFRVFDKVAFIFVSRQRIKQPLSSWRENESIFKDGNGFVSTSEIKFVLSRLGVEFSDDELGEMVRKWPKPCKYKINAWRRVGGIGNCKICIKYVLQVQDAGLKTVNFSCNMFFAGTRSRYWRWPACQFWGVQGHLQWRMNFNCYPPSVIFVFSWYYLQVLSPAL